MRPPKVFLLFFIAACLGGIGFTYCLYDRQAKAYKGHTDHTDQGHQAHQGHIAPIGYTGYTDYKAYKDPKSPDCTDPAHYNHSIRTACQTNTLESSVDPARSQPSLTATSALPPSVSSQKTLRKDLQAQYTENKPVRRLNKLSTRLAHTQAQEEALYEHLAFNQKASQALAAYPGEEKGRDPLVETLRANTLSSLAGKADQAQSRLEELESAHTQLEEELDQLQPQFTQA